MCSDETFAEAVAYRLAGAQQAPQSASEAIDGIVGPKWTPEGRAELIAIGMDPDAAEYVGVTKFFARPIFLVRDSQGSLNDHITSTGRPPSLWEVAAVATFRGGDNDTVGVIYCKTKGQAEKVAATFNRQLKSTCTSSDQPNRP